MTVEQFNEAVAKRAHGIVNDRVRNFETALYKALTDLGCDKVDYRVISAVRRVVIAQVLLPRDDRKYPKALWDLVEKEVRDEALSTMDTIQKILVAKDPEPDDYLPNSEKESE